VKGIRRERLEEEVRTGLAGILLGRVSDPRLRLVMVTRVELSGDMSHARVYVSVLGDESAQESALRVLVHAGPYLRHELGKGLRVRRTPELSFRADGGIRYSVRLQQILRELGMEQGTPLPEGEAVVDADEDAGEDRDESAGERDPAPGTGEE
jgi:ribosome-binding factor A